GVTPTVEENRQTRPKKYSELTEAQQLQDDCDVQATNIILHGLLLYVYALVNHYEAAKDIWDRGETLYEYYWRFSQLINDMHTIRMTMQQVQVNTKFLNALPSEWSKFVTDVKLAKSLYTTNYDQLYAYLSQHERHANEVRITRERYLDPLAFVANSPTLYNPSQSPQHSGSLILAVPMFQQGEDPIECINKAMAFLSAVASRFPPSNNQLRTSSNPRNQATIQDGRVTVQQVQGRQNQSYAGTRNRGIATNSKGNFAAAEAQEVGQILDEEQLAFLADPAVILKFFYEVPYSAKAVLMVNLLSCDPEVLSEDTNPSAANDLLVLSMVEQMTDHEIDTPKETLSNNVKEKESLLKTLTIFKTESKEKESKYIDKEIVLEKQNKELENIISQRIQPTLYDGSVIAKEHAMISVIDDEETLILEEESRSKMLDKQNDPISIETNIKISLIDYSKLNKIKEDFEKLLKDTFNTFDKTLLDEITEVQTVFNQIEVVVDQCSIDKNASEIQIKQLSIDNDQLLKQIMSQEIVHIAASYVDSLNVNKSCVDECHKCLELETGLLKKKDLIEKDVYDKVLKIYSTLEKHCISLELTTQLNQEIFQKDNFLEN
ncbi:hypothetical protein Tco_1257670, partial [Tanacetum coccineum]